MMDPQAKSVVDAMQADARPMPSDDRIWLDDYRRQLDAVVAMQGPVPLAPSVDRAVSTGTGALGLRLYRPTEHGPWPTLLFIHGGGFVGGSLDGYDIPLRWLALRSGWQIAAIDYRLAPEHPFPAAPDDCAAALRSLFEDASLGAERTRIAVGGDSAGGLLATVLARSARDGGLRLALQVLLYPNTDLREGGLHASRRQFDGIVIRIDELYRSLDLYLGGTDRSRPDVSPLLADDLAGLCPALLVTNGYDPLRDEGEAYGRRLEAAGVTVETLRMDGMIHTALQRAARIDAGDALITRIAAALKAAATAPSH
ncbi:alpha/beta hydrolase [Beijerinckia sp. L45]|uniref:alpha/beta hydrolase n=1 Tax=Beijerinckia sp. L45 TaxID=1641855 RepID=UPI00131E61AC|nr:alpha/beta hydrolase [Beijerinckia sp. L45]